MSVTFIPKQNGVDYQCLSTDMSGSSPVEGISWIGASVYVSDTAEWFRVIDEMYLVPLVNPPSSGSITVSISGSDLQIGAVELKDGETDNRAKIASGSNISSTDIAVAVYQANTVSASLVAGGSGIWVEDGNITIDNVVSASFVAGGSSVWVDSGLTVEGTISASLVAGGSSVYIENQNISCTGFVSSVTNDDLDPWLTTTTASQVVNFANTLNDLKIYSNSSALYVQLNHGSHCVHIPASSNLERSGYEID